MAQTDFRDELYEKFIEKFPLETLKDMSLELYTNLNRQDSFCYWLESILYNLGSIWGGTAYKFGIYRYAKKPNNPSVIVSDDEYAWYKKYNAHNRYEAYKTVLDTVITIAEAANEGRFWDVDKITELGDAVKWKIAFLYSNKRLIPIYKREMIEEVAMKMGYVNARKAKISDLQSFLYEKKGDKELFEYYDYLLTLCSKENEFLHDKWDDAIIHVLGDNVDPLKTIDIYNKIEENKFYNTSGKTPQNTVSAQLTRNSNLYYENVGDGYYTLSEKGNERYKEILLEIIGNEEIEHLPEVVSTPQYSDTDFLDEVFITSNELCKLKALIENKQNIILQGAPGVGKTFTAERLAYTLMGVKDKLRVEMVQFHQNYSYEDFIMGYKPNEAGGFELKQGVFYKFCKKAANSPEKDFFFIIDEINRGNLSKIFGELLMLIENSYRGKEIKLAYTDELFTVPKNLYIIGMMNTADRSLAMIDYALRRRFSFFEMHPGFDSEGFKNYLATLSNEKLNLVIKQIQTLNEIIRKDESLGQGFCIGHSYFCNQTEFSAEWLNNVIEYDIEPMLKEYWFDEVEKYNTQISILRNLLK